MSLHQTLFGQRILLGLLVLAGLLWLFTDPSDEGRDRQQRARIGEMLDAVQQERDLNRSINKIVQELFLSLSNCACEGDLAQQRQLWQEFETLMAQEQELAATAGRLFANIPERSP